jgi:hypothetical protein
MNFRQADRAEQSSLDWLRGKGVDGNKPLHTLRTGTA